MAIGTDLAFDVIARDKASKTMDDVGKSSDRLGDKLGDFAKKGAAAVAAFAVAGAAAVTALAAAGAQFALEKSKADTLLAGQIGATGLQAKELGKATGRMYAAGWAESTADAANAIRATIQQKLVDPNAGAAVIQAMSTKTAAAAAIMQEDVGRVASAVANMLRNGMAKSADEAFDLLVAATQRGINKNEDLLDTLNEYSTQFRQLGINGATALGLLSQAMQAGARDSDTAADALKEFAIRAIDGSATSAKGFQLLGLDAKKMTAQIAQGGQAAAEGLSTVLARLRSMKDPVDQNAAAVALFGTKAEDLGKALFAMKPEDAFKDLTGEIGTAQGAMDRFIQSQSSAGSRLESIWKGSITALADRLLPWIEKVLDKIEEWANNPQLQQWVAGLETEIDKMVAMAGPMLDAMFKFMASSFVNNKDEIAVGIKGLVLLFLSLGATIMGLVGIATYVGGFLVDSFKISFNAITGYMEFFVNAAAAAFGWIPGLGGELRDAAARFHEFRERVNNELSGITKDVQVKVSLKGITDSGEVMAVRLGRRARGGPVTAGQPYIVGEHRPELFVPNQSGMILPSVPTGGGGAVSATGGVVARYVGPPQFADIVAWLMTMLRLEIGNQGGNVQTVLGQN